LKGLLVCSVADIEEKREKHGLTQTGLPRTVFGFNNAKKAKLLKNETGAVTWFSNQPVNRLSFKNQTLCPMPRALALIW